MITLSSITTAPVAARKLIHVLIYPTLVSPLSLYAMFEVQPFTNSSASSLASQPTVRSYQRHRQLFHPPTLPLRSPEMSSTRSFTHRLSLPCSLWVTFKVQPFPNSSASSLASPRHISAITNAASTSRCCFVSEDGLFCTNSEGRTTSDSNNKLSGRNQLRLLSSTKSSCTSPVPKVTYAAR
jgi:hypothetical protein